MEPLLPMLDIARICHEANRAYCISLQDDSQPTWEKAPEWQRQSAVNGVKAVIASPRITTQELHESWLKEKQAAGWKYGPVKDAEKKEHPCFVPYSDLPLYQRKKDELFRSIVKCFINAE